MKKHMARLALAAVSVTASAALLTPAVFAQAISVNGGSIQGTITDPSGAAVANATISITSPETGFKRDLTTDKSGFYSVGPLNPGNYNVGVTAPGFQTLTVQTVIRTGTATAGSFKLSVGSSSTEINVTAGEVQVNTDQGGVSDVITKQQIDSLPVNGRNFLDLAQIEPGVILQSGESFDPTKAGYSAISVGGVSGRTTRILLDGQDITDEFVGTTIFNVSQGAIDEFQLNRSTQDVAGEVTSTGQVLVSTRSGSNSFHGQLFGQFQDHRALFARAQNGADPQFQRNQFGGSVGGPIIKDKLFFFGNSERIKQDSSAVSPVSQGAGSFFSAIYSRYPLIGTPYRETYSTVRLDYNGPRGSHYFVRGNYNVNAVTSNYGLGYSLYANRDNTPGIAGGADFTTGAFGHSFRVSYEKFHNLITDATAGNNSIYNGLPGLQFYYTAQRLYSGPNYLAPQATFQSDKQFRYDGSWSRGAHNIRFGYSMNRILAGGFASFFGLAPRISIGATTLLTGVVSSTNPFGYGCNNVVGGAPCANDPINGYHANLAYIGNGQGASTELSEFNLAGGGLRSWRFAGYLQDSWKVTPSFTVQAGVRWSTDTQRANQDLNPPTCGDVDPTLASPCGTASASTSIYSLYDPTFTGRTHQPYGNFAPQLGVVYAPGNHKTSFRGAIGMFFESNVFNNTGNSRSSLLKAGGFNDEKPFCSGGGTFNVTFPDGSTQSSINGQSLRSLCYSSLASSSANFIALQNSYQANTRANSALANGNYVGNTLTVSDLYAPTYRTPYSIQYNFGVQHELFKGAIISGDYIHNAVIHIAQDIDLNHVGAARTLNAAAARNAIAATATQYRCPTTTGAAAINCAIGAGATIVDFAGNGLDSGNEFLSGNPASYQGYTVNTGAAFPGLNPLLGNGKFFRPTGRSGYDALQVVYRQVTEHPAPGIRSMNMQVSYNLSRIVSNIGGTSTGDQFFSGGTNYWDADNPTQYIGRSGLDRKHQVNMGGSFTMKYGPRIGLIGHFYSAYPTSLTLDANGSTGAIFSSDLTGDGTISDLAPGTGPGDYMHRVKGADLPNYVSTFNSTYAGRLTPAGQALVNAGLFNYAQLNALGGVVQRIAGVPQTSSLSNPAFRTLDASFSYPITAYKLHEGLSLEPSITMYNVMNLANFTTGNSGVLLQQTSTRLTNSQTGYLTGLNSYAALNNNRVQRGSGTFNQGAARTTEFALKLNF